MKRNIIAFCIFCLCTGSLAACNDFDNPAIPDDEAPEVTPAPVPPAIDPSWNLVQMPDEGGQNPRVFVYKDKKYDALFTRTLGWNGGDGVLTTALPGGHVFWSFNDSFYGVVDGKTVTMSVKPGDKVITDKYAGTKVTLEDVEYIIVKQADILAIVE